MIGSILVVSDNPITTRLLQVPLEAEGYSVTTADPPEALRVVERRVPDLVVEDLRASGRDGFALLEALRASRPDVPVIACTGPLSAPEEARLLESGFDDRVVKPILPHALLHTVRPYLVEPPPSAVGATDDPPRILLVDDDPILLRLQSVILARSGFDVTTRVGAAAGLRAMREAPPDAVLCDVLMPEMDGLEFAAAVREDEKLAHVPVVLVTSHFVAEPDRALALRMGAVDLVFRTDDLNDAVEAVNAAIAGRSTPSRPPDPDDVRRRYIERVTAQLDRQAAANRRLALQVSGQAAALTLLATLSDLVSRQGDSREALDEVLGHVIDAAGLAGGALHLRPDGGSWSLLARSGHVPALEDLERRFGRARPFDDALEEPLSLMLTDDEGTVVLSRLAARAGADGVLLLAGAAGSVPGDDFRGFARALAGQLGQGIALGGAFDALRDSEERFRTIAEHVREALFLVDVANREVLYVSPMHEDIWGFPAEDVYRAPMKWLDAVHPADLPDVERSIRRSEAGEATTQSFRILRTDGDVRWVRVRVYPILGGSEDGREVHRLVGLVEDVTERRTAEERLVRAQRLEAVGRLAGGVAHDFNNLLTVILAEAQLMGDEVGSEGPAAESLREIAKAGERAAVLTRQMLAFSRRQIVEPAVFNVNDLVREMKALLRRIIGEDVELRTRLSPETGNVLADRGQVEQVLANLIVNARDAMPAGGHLTIATSNERLDDEYAGAREEVVPGDYVRIMVSDTGIGMDEDVKTHVFDPFFTTKDPGVGTGLGLATSYGIVKQAGGHIVVYSEPDIGTTVAVYLPRVISDAEAEVAASPGAAAGGDEHILLVEDELAVRTVAARILRAWGYTVLEAQDGTEALDLVEHRAGDVDLLLTDVVLPGAGGREVADELMARRPEARVLFMSGYADDVILQHRLLEQDFELLQKPFTADSLTRRVRKVLDRDV